MTRVVLGQYYTNCYLVAGGEPDKAILIDPADDGDALKGLLDSRGLVPAAILLTHGHYDHFLAVPRLQAYWVDLPVYCHALDVPEELTEEDLGEIYPTAAAFQNLMPLTEGETLVLAGLNIEVLHTPGHTPGSVTFLIEDSLFTGDTLFCGDIGRTDFKGGDLSQMMKSLARLAAMTGDYTVLPGHDMTTTLKREQCSNPYLKQAAESENKS